MHVTHIQTHKHIDICIRTTWHATFMLRRHICKYVLIYFLSRHPAVNTDTHTNTYKPTYVGKYIIMRVNCG